MQRSGGPPRLSYSKENMAKSCGTWRHKSSERKAEVKLTSSLPAKLLCMPAQQSSRACWWLPSTFYWGRHLHLTPLSYHKGPLQWRNSPLQLLLPHQCPSSLLGPKDITLPQILWRACLWVEPCLKTTLEGPPSSNQWEIPPWNKALKPSHVEAFGWDSDLVKEAWKEFFLKHSYNFVMEGTCDLWTGWTKAS